MSEEHVWVSGMGESVACARKLARVLGLSLVPLLERGFPDGEHELRLGSPLAGQDLIIVESLHESGGPSLDSRICRLLLALQALRDSPIGRIALVAPYLAYARHDRRGEAAEPLMLQHLARLLESSGVGALITLEAHNVPAFENAFRIPVWSVDPSELFLDQLTRSIGAAEAGASVVVSPDAGGVKRAQAFAHKLALRTSHRVPLAWVSKSRRGDRVEAHELIGDVRGRRVVLLDDMISTGATLAEAARLCRRRGALGILAFATHGLFSGDACRLLWESEVETIFVTDSVETDRLDPAFAAKKVRILESSDLLGSELRRRLLGSWLGS